jgi:outer membrane protein assembly factor BamB
MNLSEKDIKTLRTVSLASGLFTLIIAIILLFGYIQLRQIKPLQNPLIVQLKEQFDGDTQNKELQDQIRSLDLIARRAYFTATWQVQAGSYLLLGGAVVFILTLRLLSANDKTIPSFPGDPTDEKSILAIRRKWLLVPAAVIFVGALAVSFAMRKTLPNPPAVRTAEEIQAQGAGQRAQGSGLRAQSQEQGAEAALQMPPNTAQGTEAVAQSAELRAQGPTSAEASVGGAGTVQEEQVPALKPPGPGETFPAFRGKGSRGFAEGSNYPTTWDGAAGKGVVWKVKIPKPGYNSPVIWGNKLFITGADASGEEIYCLNVADGKTIWQTSPRNIPGAPASPPETSEDTGLAAPTAAVNNEFVVAIFGTGNLVCADHNGKVIWAKNIGVPDNHYGHSSSLIIHKENVIVQFDHNLKATVFAFNLRTGEKTWETIRKNAKISWASPVIATIGGKEQVILTTDPYVAGYDLTTGAELWRAKGLSAEIGPSVGTNSTMVFAGNEFAKLIGIKPGAGEEPLWQDNEFLPEVASLVATEDHLFVATSFGAVACYDTKTGKIIWQHDFDYGFYASPIIAGGNVYLPDVAGVTQIFKASGTFEPVASPPLGEKTVSTPAFAHGKIFMRGSEHLYCIGKN